MILLCQKAGSEKSHSPLPPSLPEYCGGWSVTDVQADSEATFEELHREVLSVAGVEEDPVLLVRLQQDGEVDGGGGVERLQLHVSSRGDQLDRDQVLASLPW